MEIYSFVPSLFLYWISAFYDAERQEVPDLVSACVWAVVAGSVFLGFPQDIYGISILAFAGVYCFAVWDKVISNREILGWADILLLPPFLAYFSYLYVLAENPLILLLIAWLAILVPSIISKMHKNRPVPLMPYLAVAYTASLLYVFL